MSEAIWREPAEESVDLYPGLGLADNRVSGSITLGQSRLPLWAFISGVVSDGWEHADYHYDAFHYGTADTVAGFIYDLLEARGEFGRLLLVLADAERRGSERQDAAIEAHFASRHPGGRVCECGFRDPPPWWDDDELKTPVVEQLRRCLAALEQP